MRKKEAGTQERNTGEEGTKEPLTVALPRAVTSVSGNLCEVEKVVDKEMETEPVDQHPDKGLVSGSSKDGLSHDVAMEEEEETGRAEEGEEARIPKTLPTPVYVSKTERDEHELTHTPYRSWCEYCVRCRGRNAQHRSKGEDKKGQVPRIAFDYWFMSHQDEEAKENHDRHGRRTDWG